jgi:outer membrane lipoprotein LolB
MPRLLLRRLPVIIGCRLALCLALCLCLLSACSLLRPAAVLTGPARDPATLASWSAEGKLGLHYQDKGGSLYFTWRQTGSDFALDLAGPLGQGRTRLAGRDGQVSMDNPTTGHLEAGTPEALMQQALGWQAPVSYLRWWLRGLPATARAVVQKDSNGLVSQISEDGWQASIERYVDAPPYRLPGKLLITGPETKLTVVVSNWAPAP